MWREAGGKIIVGATTRINKEYVWFRAIRADIVIGEHCDIGPQVFITTSSGGHYLGYHKSSRVRPVVIKDWVWIGFGAMIGSGVTIGEGAVIGMGAVVTKNVEPFHRIIEYNKDIGLRPDHAELQEMIKSAIL